MQGRGLQSLVKEKCIDENIRENRRVGTFTRIFAAAALARKVVDAFLKILTVSITEYSSTYVLRSEEPRHGT